MSDLQLFWGDLHNHNAIGYGKGSIERSYAIARNSLDFYAFTPHGWWPDVPDSDPEVKRKHLEGFDRVREQWPDVLAAAKDANRPGEFVAFVGFEWHTSEWGDYHVIFPGDAGEVCRADTLAGLLHFAQERGALAVPHHPAYKRGWRGTNWAEHDKRLCPVVEVHSEHGCSFETPSHLGMLNHSMGGACRSQTVLEQLRQGKIVGFTAGTDDHDGVPGCYGEGLTGVIAAELSREAILDALRRRRTVAVTGDRIGVSFHMGEGMMGDVLPADTPREMRLRVEAPDEIDYVELNKNGTPLKRWRGGDVADAGDARRLLRIEWGWGPMGGDKTTRWRIQGRLDGGTVLRTIPCFVGGPASFELTNRLDRTDAHSFAIQSHTSRRNVRPTQSAIVEIDGEPDARLTLDISGEYAGEVFNLSTALSMGELHGKDAWYDILGSFSAPKSLSPPSTRIFETSWKTVTHRPVGGVNVHRTGRPGMQRKEDLSFFVVLGSGRGDVGSGSS